MIGGCYAGGVYRLGLEFGGVYRLGLEFGGVYRLGLGDAEDRLQPAHVVGAPPSVCTVACGLYHMGCITESGEVGVPLLLPLLLLLLRPLPLLLLPVVPPLLLP